MTQNITIHPLKAARCDSSLMKQVWINLISNAVKYSKKVETPKIEIGSYETDTTVVYYVKDNGAGFDMKFAAKLFGVFVRLHNRTEFEGTGVGLALVSRIITKHGGKVWANGKVNEGAVFYFSLPKQ
jgi:light-regulated signal transduction histidine kinase (bacteriophytochrome)